MKVVSNISNSFGSNCFILVGNSAAVIDPGFTPDFMLKQARELHIVDLFYINTHCHFDHCRCVPELQKSIKGRYLIHENEAAAVENGLDEFLLSSLFGEKPFKIHVDRKLKDGDIVDLRDFKLEVIHTPGHTPGSICLYEPTSKSLFTGDTIFADGVGRTDFPGGSMKQLKESIEKLMKLCENRGVSKVYPGHGDIADGDCIDEVYGMFF